MSGALKTARVFELHQREKAEALRDSWRASGCSARLIPRDVKADKLRIPVLVLVVRERSRS